MQKYNFIENPDSSEVVTDSRGEKIYYYKKIQEFGDRVLKVVTANSNPIRIITIHFHRERFKRKNMKVRYDKEIDAIYFDLSVNRKSVSQDEISDGVILDYD